MHVLGIDIGGTGIKAAPVDVATGKLLDERQKVATPQPATPAAVADVVRELAGSFKWSGVTGATFPGVVTTGTVRTAANVDHSWIGTDAAKLFSESLGLGTEMTVLNDADAAGIDAGAADLHGLRLRDAHGAIHAAEYQAVERLVDGQQFERIHSIRPRQVVWCEIHAWHGAAVFAALLAACIFNEDPPHRLGRRGEEMAAMVPLWHRCLADQA